MTVNIMNLMDALDLERKNAIAAENFEASMVYSTAEDLADSILKGRYLLEEGLLSRLISVYEDNGRRIGGDEEVYWRHSAQVVRDLFPEVNL